MTAEMRIKVKLFIKLLPGYAFFFLVLSLLALVYGLIAGSPIGIVPLFISFISLRYTYKKCITYHNPSTKKCVALSIAMFSICSFPLILLNLRISLIASVPVAIGMTWLLYCFGLKSEYEKKLYQSHYTEHFDTENCTKDQLIKRCNELNFSKDKTDLCIKMFIDRDSYNKLAEEYCVEPGSIAIRKMRLRKKLNK